MSHPEPPVPNLLAEAVRLATTHFSDSVMLATVSELDGNQLFIQRPGHAADAASYATLGAYAAGAIVGDIVLMLRTGQGNWIVLGKVISN